MADMNTIKKMPGFIAYWGSNVPSTPASETQLEDTEKAITEAKSDQQYANTNNGGEKGKAE